MSDYWFAFAASGNPNRGHVSRPHWPQFDPKTSPYLELGSTIKAGTGLFRERYLAIDAIDAKAQTR
jgi:carboxylesterase type B